MASAMSICIDGDICEACFMDLHGCMAGKRGRRGMWAKTDRKISDTLILQEKTVRKNGLENIVTF